VGLVHGVVAHSFFCPTPTDSGSIVLPINCSGFSMEAVSIAGSDPRLVSIDGGMPPAISGSAGIASFPRPKLSQQFEEQCALARDWRCGLDRIISAPAPLFLIGASYQPPASVNSIVGKASMQRINVLSIQRISAEDRAKIEAVAMNLEWFRWLIPSRRAVALEPLSWREAVDAAAHVFGKIRNRHHSAFALNMHKTSQFLFIDGNNSAITRKKIALSLIKSMSVLGKQIDYSRGGAPLSIPIARAEICDLLALRPYRPQDPRY
jgi:hypothetical protein